MTVFGSIIHLQFLFDIRYIGKINSAIMNSNHAMHHSLVRPLRQKRSDRVISSIQNKQYWRSVGFAKVKQLTFLLYLILRANS